MFSLHVARTFFLIFDLMLSIHSLRLTQTHGAGHSLGCPQGPRAWSHPPDPPGIPQPECLR